MPKVKDLPVIGGIGDTTKILVTNESGTGLTELSSIRGNTFASIPDATNEEMGAMDGSTVVVMFNQNGEPRKVAFSSVKNASGFVDLNLAAAPLADVKNPAAFQVVILKDGSIGCIPFEAIAPILRGILYGVGGSNGDNLIQWDATREQEMPKGVESILRGVDFDGKVFCEFDVLQDCELEISHPYKTLDIGIEVLDVKGNKVASLYPEWQKMIPNGGFIPMKAGRYRLSVGGENASDYWVISWTGIKISAYI